MPSFLTKMCRVCEALRRGRIVRILGAGDQHLMVITETAEYGTLCRMQRLTMGLLCLAKPARWPAPTLRPSVCAHFQVGRIECGRLHEAGSDAAGDRIIIPILCGGNGVLSRPGAAECAIDLARLAGASPSAIICTISNSLCHGNRLGVSEDFSNMEKVRIAEIVECRSSIKRDWWSARCYHTASWTNHADSRLRAACGK